MKSRLVAGVALLGVACDGAADREPTAAAVTYLPRSGDVIFHVSRSEQSPFVRRATGSEYTHVGIVYAKDGKAVVYEAAEPVGWIDLDRWTARGEGGRYVVKRLADADRVLTPDAVARMLEVGRAFEGRPYDSRFEWSDDHLYCSELVWKIFERALDIELGDLQTLGDYDWSDPEVAAEARRRWGRLPPGDEPAVSPAAVFACDRLVTVFRN